MLNVLIRTDASLKLGMGHAMRCLTLADGLRQAGAQVSFACCTLPGDICDFIVARGYKVHRMPPIKEWQEDAKHTMEALAEDAMLDWLIVDHYSLDARWESAMRRQTRAIMAIDDLADRPHDCDVLLDQNYYKSMASRYEGLVPAACLKLLGPRYTLLRPAFREARRQMRKRDGAVRKILVFFGGADPQNITAKALKAIELTKRADISVDVVIGNTNPNRQEIEKLCQRQANIRLHIQAENMAELMVSADLSLGAGGSTMWERCAVGLPTLAVVFAANQEQSTQDTAETGAIEYLGWADKLSVEALAEALKKALAQPAYVVAMSRCAADVLRDLAPDGELPVVAALFGRVAA